jgi:rubrerythrin
MESPTQIGMQNRTGLQMSPVHSQELLQTVTGVDGIQPPPEGDGAALARARAEYAADADPIGTIPPPGTAKGMVKSGAKMLTGKRPQAFIDKLAERAAFERGGARLYDAILAKFRIAAQTGASGSLPQDLTEANLLEIREEEAEHFRLVVECIQQLGADPTAETPSADLVGVESMGLLQAVSEPRTTMTQCLHTALGAELIDNAGWELLIEQAEQMGNAEMAARFRAALQEEEDHLRRVKGWYVLLTQQESQELAS